VVPVEVMGVLMKVSVDGPVFEPGNFGCSPVAMDTLSQYLDTQAVISVIGYTV